jgi:hypothetical protein
MMVNKRQCILSKSEQPKIPTEEGTAIPYLDKINFENCHHIKYNDRSAKIYVDAMVSINGGK